MNEDNLRRLRDAVARRDREVEVDPNGKIREVPPAGDPADKSKHTPHSGKATKLSDRTFGA